MAALDDATREHEEYRLRLETEKEIRLAGIDVHRRGRRGAGDGARRRAWRRPNIDIVGGDSVFFDQLIGSIALGKSVDGFVDTLRRRAGRSARPYLDGDASFTDDLEQAARLGRAPTTSRT